MSMYFNTTYLGSNHPASGWLPSRCSGAVLRLVIANLWQQTFYIDFQIFFFSCSALDTLLSALAHNPLPYQVAFCAASSLFQQCAAYQNGWQLQGPIQGYLDQLPSCR